MSLPIIYALDAAAPRDSEQLHAIYARPGAANEEEIALLLGILDRANARRWCQAQLAEYCDGASVALDQALAQADFGATAPATAAATALRAMVAFVAVAARR